MFLVDTNIVSLTAPGRDAAAPSIAGWMQDKSALLYLSVMTIAEVEQGIERLRRIGATRRHADLTTWLRGVVVRYRSRLLPLDLDVTAVLGRITDQALSRGPSPGTADLIIAATALHHGYTVVTRNVRHFAGLGVPVLNPYDLPDTPP